MNAILNVLLNRESKYNKALVAAFGAVVSISLILGYPDFAAKVASIGTVLGVALVGNQKEVKVVGSESPEAGA